MFMQKQVALVTGASRGIGAAIARELSRQGMAVAVHYNRSEAQARALAAELPEAIAVRADMADARAVADMVEQVAAHYGRIDALVNNAGVALWKLAMDTTVEEWDALFAVNVRGAFAATRAALPHMVEAQRGSIVNVSSMWGQVGASCEVAYSASKAALIGFTKALAKEMGGAGIRVNCVCPGVIATDMLRDFDEAAMAELRQETPLGCIGTPEEVARAVAFLSGDGARYITGQVLGVNGGFVI
ncbi:MAG: 3-oxoacyl-ACP reductase FabG [Clostridia bacterium]|nr:3-oxoacyl-ACP reductase FabG [Clostridia bacterium]